MITCNNLTMQYRAGRALFKDVQLSLLRKNRYAIIGANGAGKSTFLKLLAGEEESSAGTIDKPKDITLGILKQDHFRYQHYDVIDVVLAGKPVLTKLFHEKDTLLTQAHLSETECYRLAEIEEMILHHDGYSARSRAEKILTGLGISLEAQQGPMSALSGGYKLRVLLAQALFQDPDVLLLDEPTNHLDIISTTWLESFLVNDYKGLLIFISHDRFFIDNVSTHILDMDYETITPYPDRYDAFLTKKAAVLSQKEHELASKQEKIDTMQAYVDRFRASASRSKQAMSRLKMIEKIEMPDIKSSSRIAPKFNFTQKRPSGKEVLRVKHLSKSFPPKELFKNFHFQLQRGQKCALIGPNGIGKTTLLRVLLNQLPADNGEIVWHENTSIGFFAQDFHELLNPEMDLLHWLGEQVTDVPESAVRNVLGQMLFSGEDAYKKIKVLSGGECARLILAKLLLEKHNVLILDEPTNHLDLETIDSLIAGLQHFPGTILCVSHNRYFVQKVTSSLLVILPHKTDVFSGTYEEYLAKNGKDYLIKSYEAAAK